MTHDISLLYNKQYLIRINYYTSKFGIGKTKRVFTKKYKIDDDYFETHVIKLFDFDLGSPGTTQSPQVLWMVLEGNMERV